MSNQDKPHVFVRSFDDGGINEVMDKLEKIEAKHDPSQPIVVQIDSYGGSVKGMSVLYDKLKSMMNPIFTYTASNAMSAGAILLSTTAAKGMRYASPEAVIMIHELQAGAVGDIKDIEDSVNYIRMVNKKWMHILAKSMGLKSHSDIRKLIKEKAIGQDVYLSAYQAQKLGLIDEVASLRVAPSYFWDVQKSRK